MEPGRYDVVLDNEMVGLMLHEAFGHATEGDRVLADGSVLQGRVGEVVASELVSIVYDGLVEGRVYVPFDDEGVATRAKSVLGRGVFKTLLHSYYTACRMGSEPTGNGFRQRPASQPVPSFTNLMVRPGKGSSESFAEDVRRGIVVYEVIGSWMSDPTTGQVKATVTHGLLIERGRPVRPVKGVVMGGNIYRLLSENLQEVGGNVEVVGNAVVPSLWVSDVDIAGS